MFGFFCAGRHHCPVRRSSGGINSHHAGTHANASSVHGVGQADDGDGCAAPRPRTQGRGRAGPREAQPPAMTGAGASQAARTRARRARGQQDVRGAVAARLRSHRATPRGGAGAALDRGRTRGPGWPCRVFLACRGTACATNAPVWPQWAPTRRRPCRHRAHGRAGGHGRGPPAHRGSRTIPGQHAARTSGRTLGRGRCRAGAGRRAG